MKIISFLSNVVIHSRKIGDDVERVAERNLDAGEESSKMQPVTQALGWIEVAKVGIPAMTQLGEAIIKLGNKKLAANIQRQAKVIEGKARAEEIKKAKEQHPGGKEELI